jgi:hypothetical protein
MAAFCAEMPSSKKLASFEEENFNDQKPCAGDVRISFSNIARNSVPI